LSAPSKAAIKRAHSRVAEIGSLKNEIEARLMVCGQGDKIVRTADGDLIAPVNKLIGVNFSRTEMLAENIRDGEIFVLAGKTYRKARRLTSLNINFSLKNGGGADIAYCLSNSVKEQMDFVLAITDGDVDHPECGPSIVSQNCEKIVNESAWICAHAMLPCREVENLVPVNLLHDSIESHLPDAAEVHQRHAKIEEARAKRGDCYKFADLKEGTPGFHCGENDPSPDRRKFWCSVAKDLKNEFCGNCKKAKECTCNLLEGLGGNTLKRVLDHCANLSDLKLFERSNSSDNKDDWLAIGKVVFTWGVADAVMRV